MAAFADLVREAIPVGPGPVATLVEGATPERARGRSDARTPVIVGPVDIRAPRPGKFIGGGRAAASAAASAASLAAACCLAILAAARCAISAAEGGRATLLAALATLVEALETAFSGALAGGETSELVASESLSEVSGDDELLELPDEDPST